MSGHNFVLLLLFQQENNQSSVTNCERHVNNQTFYKAYSTNHCHLSPPSVYFHPFTVAESNDVVAVRSNNNNSCSCRQQHSCRSHCYHPNIVVVVHRRTTTTTFHCRPSSSVVQNHYSSLSTEVPLADTLEHQLEHLMEYPMEHTMEHPLQQPMEHPTEQLMNLNESHTMLFRSF
jgi:hypothetical protein